MKNKRLITFSELYGKFIEKLNENYSHYEKIRLTKLKEIKTVQLCSFIINCFICLILSIAFIMDPQNNSNKHSLSGLLITFFLIFIIPYYCFKFSGKYEYRKYMKSLLLPLLLGGIKDLKINKDKKPRFEETQPFNIKNNSYTMYDDSFIGIYNDIFFKISEICDIRYFRGTKTRNFLGIICTFDLNKKFETKIKLSDKEFPSINPKIATLIGYMLIISAAVLGCILSFTVKKGWVILPIIFALILLLNMIAPSVISFIWNILTKVQNRLNKRELMDNFKVTTENENEAWSVLTPAFMKNIKYLRKKFKAKGLECIFENKRIMLYFKTNKDFFEIWDINKPINDRNSIRNFYFELTALLKIIDYFKLNEKTGQ